MERAHRLMLCTNKPWVPLCTPVPNSSRVLQGFHNLSSLHSVNRDTERYKLIYPRLH